VAILRQIKKTANSSSFEEVASRLEAAAIDAVAILHAALFDLSASTRAAVAILNFGTISAESEKLENRVSELERVKWKK